MVILARFGRAAAAPLAAALLVTSGLPGSGSSAEAVAAAPAGNAGAPVDFNRDVLPILSENCFKCHGPDEGARKSKLRLDTAEGAAKGGKSGDAAVVAGKPEESELWSRITEENRRRRMPPESSGKELKPEQVETLRRWIEQGGRYEVHWSFAPPVRPPLPEVQRAWWPKNEVDFFTLARMEQHGLVPAPEASRETLIRRLYLDLTGLPPSLEEVDRFVADSAPDAFERLVERVLASPRYGEKMAQEWLDLARFGDTSGYHYDSTRTMWLWRDRVIASFNRNQPYDQFTIEQLAGDLLPDPTLDQRIASGFNRCTRFNEEGGADPNEFQVAYNKDRVNTLGQVWLGLTLGCAECHSHKYDPVSNKEYYQLYAFFCSLEEPMVSMNHNQRLPPLVEVPSPEQERTLAQARAELADVEKTAAAAAAQYHYEEPAAVGESTPTPAETLWVDDAIPDDAEHYGDWVFEEPPAPAKSGRLAMKRSGKGIHQHFFTHAARIEPIHDGDRLFAWVYLDPKDPPDSVMLQWNSSGGQDGWHHRAYWGADQCFYAGTPDNPEHHRVGELPRPGEWTRLEVDPASVGLAAGMTAYGMAFTQHDGTAWWDAAGIVSTHDQEPGDWVWFDDDLPRGANAQGDSPWQWVTAPEPVHTGARATKRSANGLSQHFFTEAAEPFTVQPGDRLFAWVFLDPREPPRTIMLQWNDGNWEHRAYWGENTIGWGTDGTGSRRRMGDLPKRGEWVRLEVDARAVDLRPGAKVSGWAFTQFDGTVFWDTPGVKTYGPPDERHLHSLLAWQARERANPASTLPADVEGILRLDAAARTPEQVAQLREYYVRHVNAEARETFAPFDAKAAALQKTIEKTESEIPYTLVSHDLNPGRKAYLLTRGDFRQRAEEVTADVPAFLPRLPEDAPRNRLTLARWLVDGKNPLVARVTVNRLWEQLFGTGLVRTLGDFGAQGEEPTHPQLLDWLATEFVRSGWDVKHMLRRMVTSATYRQAPAFDERRRALDPSHRLVCGAPRHRLEAEEIRDNALAIAGLLSPRVGGPSVMPYQPDGYYLGKLDVWVWTQSRGDDLYRRGLYTFWRRTTLYPTFALFDAPTREICCVERPRTNTPLQALALMNDPQFVEAARVFAQSLLEDGGRDGGPGIDERLTTAFRRATARRPEAAELKVLRDLHAQQHARFAADPAAVDGLLAIGKAPRPAGLDPVELATWTAICNVILCLDETITRE
jgi:hypothetical protein